MSGEHSSLRGVIKNANGIGWYDVTLGSSAKVFKIRSFEMRRIDSNCKSAPKLRSIAKHPRGRGGSARTNASSCPSRSTASATNQSQRTGCMLDGRELALFDEIDCRDKDDVW